VQITQAKPGPKARKLWDRYGLYLLIQPNNVRGWRWKYYFRGRERLLSFGPYPLVSLKKARQLRDQARLQLRDGIDPQLVRRQRKHAGLTFAMIANEWFQKKHGHSAPRTRKKVRWFLDALIIPALGSRTVAELEPPDILALLRPIEARKRHETAHRARELCGQIFRYAIAMGKASRDMAADVSDALAPTPIRHFPALTKPADVGRLLRAIDTLDYDTSVGVALRLAPYLFVRPGELRTMAWADVDLDRALWRIPSGTMKSRREHLVPLATQVVTQLKTGPTRNGYVFPSPRTKTRPLSETALNAALRALGYTREQMTSHGFRALARTLLDEQLRIPPDVIEVQLAHTVRGALGNTYNRSQYLEARIDAMQRWADYLDQLRAAVNGSSGSGSAG
jgi:integrase